MKDAQLETKVKHSKDLVYSFALIFSLVVVLAVGGFGYWYFWIKRDFSSVYAQLGISPLPPNVELETEISKRLEQLSHEPCYKDGVIGFADALITSGYPREADTSLLSFAKRCGGVSDPILVRRHQALMKASDFGNALNIANDLVASDPVKATYRYIRGQTYEQLKDFDRALNDYIVSVQLLGTPSRVAGFHFYDVARMYAALGRFCDAITAVETFVAFGPAARRTQQSVSMILEYSKKGSCGVDYARGNAQIPLKGADGVQLVTVTVNGVTGTFIVDTGATYLSLTAAFSERAKINPGAAGRLPIKTVGGTAQAILGTATTVAVRNAEAHAVTVAVIQDSRDPFGPRIDGLLGMSFLARFNMRISANGIELTAAPTSVGDDADRNLPDVNAARGRGTK
jgi:clan AA aspartic protease (TIGR02281 family)